MICFSCMLNVSQFLVSYCSTFCILSAFVSFHFKYLYRLHEFQLHVSFTNFLILQENINNYKVSKIYIRSKLNETIIYLKIQCK